MSLRMERRQARINEVAQQIAEDAGCESSRARALALRIHDGNQRAIRASERRELYLLRKWRKDVPTA